MTGVTLSPIQYRAAKAATVAAAAGAVATNMTAHAPGTFAAYAAAFLVAISADAIATYARHWADTAYLAWKEIPGRGGHGPIVAGGLAVTFFGNVAPVESMIESGKALVGSDAAPAMDLFLRLFIGIEPMALVVAVAAARKAMKNGSSVRDSLAEGARVLCSETWKNATGSAVATIAIPLYEGVLTHLFGPLSGIARGVATLGHYFTGYYAVLRANGWWDTRKAAHQEIEAGKMAAGTR